MLVERIKLNNYRNYLNQEFEFSKNLNLIIGKNGTGKTNILESLIFISNTKSFRTLNDKDLIQKDKDYLRIICQSDTNEYKAVVNKNGKHLYINNLPINKTSEFIGNLNCILFKPSDLEIIHQSPKERRRILDLEIGKVSKRYLNALLKYNLLLKDKNRLLKENNIDEVYLNLINEQMIPNIKIILEERNEFINFINYHLSNYYNQISNKHNKIRILYKKCSENEEIEKRISDSKEKDFYYHYATFGPHHEDYQFMVDNDEIGSIASQGQIRMILISFKLAIKDYIIFKSKKTPILLLDDILSELDIDNKKRLLKLISNDIQVIITGTDLLGIENKDYKLIELKERENG